MIILLLKKEKNMEIQEQQFVRELAESRMQIELLRNRVLLRYYAQLLELDIIEANPRSESSHEQYQHARTLCPQI